LLAIVTVALRAPAALGANVMLKLHAVPAATLLHVDPLTANSPALLLVIEFTVTATVPVLLSVTARGALVVPRVVSGIATEDAIESWPVPGGGATVVPAPDIDTDSDPPPA
jgi:hypothetical protein